MSTNKILVVDDSTTTGNLLKLHLQNLGYETVGIAVNANEAMQLVSSQHPDLVLMDINLGEGINGIEVADIIMGQHNIPVIYVTAYSDEQTLAAAKHSMPYGFINKPIRPKDLKVNIEIALARTISPRQAYEEENATSVKEPHAGSHDYAVLSEALDHLVSGVIMINDQLQVYYRNRSADLILDHNPALTIRNNFLDCSSPRMKKDIIKSVRDKTSTIFTLNHLSNSVHFLLFPLSARLAAQGQGSILFLFDSVNDAHRIEDLIRTMYKLSPTEARIASRLVFNPYLADVSTTLGITYQTARTHLKRIYQKTDTNRLPALIQKIVTGPAGLLIRSTD